MGYAATPVAAHAAGFSIAVAIVHMKISLVAGFQHHVSVGTNAKSAVAQLGNDRLLIPMGIQTLAAVNKNEIISRALVFDKRKALHGAKVNLFALFQQAQDSSIFHLGQGLLGIGLGW